MSLFACAFILITSAITITSGFTFPPRQHSATKYSPALLPNRLRRVAHERSTVRIPLFHHDAKQPFVVLQPIHRRQGRRLVLTLPKDNIQILSAESGGSLPLTLSLREPDSERGRYSNTRNYVSQMPSPPHRQASKYHYGFLPMTDSEEQDRKPWNKGEVVYDMEDLIGSSGGHVTVIKAHSGGMPKIIKAKRVTSSGKGMKPMKAIFIEPKKIEAKRVHLVDANIEKVMATKGQLLGETMVVHGMKAKGVPVSFKKGVVSKSKGEDWAASNLHYVKAEPPQEVEQRDEEEPPMELHCGGNNDLGWCDLGDSYPSTEVSQIMEICEELVSRMFVEVPEDPGDMEDISSYSLSRNISSRQGAKSYWPRKSRTTDMKRSLCDINKDVIRPSFAQDVKGKWHVIIQTEAFPQRIALEVCKKPGDACSSKELCTSSQSQCVQKYSHHQLISFDPESADSCPYIRLYKFPTSCVCRIE